jgi:hypothetical protein
MENGGGLVGKGKLVDLLKQAGSATFVNNFDSKNS